MCVPCSQHLSAVIHSIAVVMTQDVMCVMSNAVHWEKQLVFTSQGKAPCLPAMLLGLLSGQPLEPAELLSAVKQLEGSHCSAPGTCSEGFARYVCHACKLQFVCFSTG